MHLEGLDLSGPSSSSLLTQGGASKAIDMVQSAIGSLSIQHAGRRLPEPIGIQTRKACNDGGQPHRGGKPHPRCNIAQEMTNLVNHRIKMQVATAMLARSWPRNVKMWPCYWASCRHKPSTPKWLRPFFYMHEGRLCAPFL